MKNIYAGLFVTIMGLLSACSDGGDKTPAQKPQQPAEHVFSGQQRALEKSKDVEQTLMDAAEQRGQEIEQQTGNQ